MDSLSGSRSCRTRLRSGPPHPNAARLFVNWLLTKEGQALWGKAVPINSRRADVEPVAPDLMPEPNRKYRSRDSWEMVVEYAKTQELARTILS